ncbi:MAG: hypothetical protein NVSMB9_13670 [Isosphaeraceae bacterium]
MSTHRTLKRLAIAAGLVLLCPIAARAQVSYGYDSLVYGQIPAQSYYQGAGYLPVYTDPGTGVYMNGTQEPFRGVAPYEDPPYGVGGLGRGNLLSTPGRRTNVLPARQVIRPRRRGRLGRMPGR